MAIFPNIILEDVVQVNDKTRLDFTKSFISKNEAAISLIEAKADTGESFTTLGAPGVSKDWYLDWQYDTAGTKTVSCRITTGTGGGAVVTTSTATLNCVTAATENLFSSDAELVALEYEIMKWVQPGRNSFLNFHRKAQKLILAWLDESGRWDADGAKLTAAAFTNLEEIRYWSAALTLHLIFSSISNDPNDVFSLKAKTYESMALGHRSRLVLRLDVDGDGTTDVNEGFKISSLDLVRR
jgi:hypothetical protein